MFNVSGLSLIQLTTALKINLYLGLSFTRESDTHQPSSKHYTDTCPAWPSLRQRKYFGRFKKACILGQLGRCTFLYFCHQFNYGSCEQHISRTESKVIHNFTLSIKEGKDIKELKFS